METERNLRLLKEFFENSYGLDNRELLYTVSEIMENSGVFLQFCRYCYHEYIEKSEFLHFLQDIDAPMKEMLPAAKFYESDPRARQDLDLVLDALSEACAQNGVTLPPKEDMVLILTQAAQATILLSRVEEASKTEQPISKPFEQLREAFFISNETILDLFLTTLLINKQLLVTFGNMLGDRYLYSNPFIRFLHDEGIMRYMVSAMAQEQNLDRFIKEGIRRYFRKTGILLDYDKAQYECSQFLLGIIASTALDEYAQGNCTLEEVLDLVE